MHGTGPRADHCHGPGRPPRFAQALRKRSAVDRSAQRGGRPRRRREVRRSHVSLSPHIRNSSLSRARYSGVCEDTRVRDMSSGSGLTCSSCAEHDALHLLEGFAMRPYNRNEFGNPMHRVLKTSTPFTFQAELAASLWRASQVECGRQVHPAGHLPLPERLREGGHRAQGGRESHPETAP